MRKSASGANSDDSGSSRNNNISPRFPISSSSHGVGAPSYSDSGQSELTAENMNFGKNDALTCFVRSDDNRLPIRGGRIWSSPSSIRLRTQRQTIAPPTAIVGPQKFQHDPRTMPSRAVIGSSNTASTSSSGVSMSSATLGRTPRSAQQPSSRRERAHDGLQRRHSSLMDQVHAHRRDVGALTASPNTEMYNLTAIQPEDEFEDDYSDVSNVSTRAVVDRGTVVKQHRRDRSRVAAPPPPPAHHHRSLSPYVVVGASGIPRSVSAGVNALLLTPPGAQHHTGNLLQRHQNRYRDTRHHSAIDTYDMLPSVSQHSSATGSCEDVGSSVSAAAERDVAKIAKLERDVQELKERMCGGTGNGSVDNGSSATSSAVAATSTPLTSSLSCPKIQQRLSSSVGVGGRGYDQPSVTTASASFLDRDAEIELLIEKLNRERRLAENARLKYEYELSHCTDELRQKHGQTSTLKSRVSELETECRLWKDKAEIIQRQAQRQSPVAVYQKQISQKDKELEKLHEENEFLTDNLSNYKERNNDLEWLRIQNEALNTTLEVREAEIEEMRKSYLSNTLETPLAMDSRGSTPVGDQQCSKAAVKLDKNFRKKLDSQFGVLQKCAVAIKCLKQTAERVGKGQPPDLDKLLGLKTESMSESETESPPRKDHMSTAELESAIARNQQKLDQIWRDVSSVQDELMNVYAKHMAEEITEQQSCKIQ